MRKKKLDSICKAVVAAPQDCRVQYPFIRPAQFMKALQQERWKSYEVGLQTGQENLLTFQSCTVHIIHYAIHIERRTHTHPLSTSTIFVPEAFVTFSVNKFYLRWCDLLEHDPPCTSLQVNMLMSKFPKFNNITGSECKHTLVCKNLHKEMINWTTGKTQSPPAPFISPDERTGLK